MQDQTGGSADLTNCDREPIHLLGRVQAFGFLVGVDGDWTITHVSANVAAFTGRQPAELIGQSATELMSPAAIHSVRNRLQFLRPRRGVEVVYGVNLLGVERSFDVSVHTVDGTIVMEFEPASPERRDMNEVSHVRLAVDQIADLTDMDRIFSMASRFVKMMTGFDKVMVYRFDMDGAGEVVGEARKHGMEPFLNLRYPASDIPRQARALYVENPIRLIADSSDEGIPVLAGKGQVGAPLDLSGSRLRSVSPIHLEYLRNMGVAASMSISIIVHGQLWGLIACHHDEPHVPSMQQRNSALLFGQMLSLVLQTKFSDEERANDRRVSELTERISRDMSAGTTTPELLKSSAEAFSALLGADGFAVVQGEAVVTGGSAPDAEDVLAIRDRLNGRPGNDVFSTHALTTFMDTAERFADRAAGFLSLPISRSPHDYILFFRQEQVRQVKWAGNPEKPVSTGERLTPRKSFEIWQTTVRGESAPWRPADLRAASQLRVMLLEVVLRITEEARRERKLAGERQELLIAELNHRVRNILGLVRGLISQTNSGGENTVDFVRKLDRRVQALARAHDQITRQNWQAAPFSKLVATEAETYLFDKKDRVTIDGPEVLLSPQAFSSMALVIHELLTNSAKYGAMSDRHGLVKITVAFDAAGGLAVEWRESGGPVVKAPERRGFGSTIIERTIPFELKGEAEISYRLEGVMASFRLPKAHVSASGDAPVTSMQTSQTAPTPKISAPSSVLVVEDNLIIAMDAEDIFLGMGSRDVVVASSVDAALLEILRQPVPFDFALLDINLGSETSFPIARELSKLGVPFLFASGYGDGVQLPDDLAATRIINKPYERATITGLFS